MTDDPNVTPPSGASQPGDPPPGAQPTTPPATAAPRAQTPPRAPRAPSTPQTSAGTGQPADLATRFLAKLIDGILLGVVYGFLVAFLLIGLVFGAMAGGSSGGYIAGVISTLITTALSVGYFVFMESSRGQTVGKMLMKIEVRGPDGHRPTMEQAIKRNAYLAIGLIGILPIVGDLLAGLLSLAAIIAIAVTINNNRATGQGWHDLFADGTSVVKIG